VPHRRLLLAGPSDPGHVGERHGGVELDVDGDAPAALPLPVAIVRHGARAGVVGGAGRSDLLDAGASHGWITGRNK